MEPFGSGDFLQGFFEESDEHLFTINQNLLRLEELNSIPERAESESGRIEQAERLAELFRSYHTLKGLAGMVGLPDAALLSHALESLLRAAQNGALPLDAALIDTLILETGVLSAVIHALRAGAPAAPQIAAHLERLEALLHPERPAPARQEVAAEQKVPKARQEVAAEQEVPAEQKVPADEQVPAATPVGEAASITTLLPGLSRYPDLLRSLGDLEERKIRAAVHDGQSLALVTFTSSAERSMRGETVDWVRQRIQEQGSLIKGAPSITDGVMRFLFLIAAPQPLPAGVEIADEMIPLPVNPLAEDARWKESPVQPTRADPVRSAQSSAQATESPVTPAPAPAAGARTGQARSYRPSASVASATAASAAAASATAASAMVASTAAASATAASASTAVTVVRVELSRLDELLHFASELFLLRARLGETIHQLNGAPTAARRELQSTYVQMGRKMRGLRQAILHARMVPLAETFNHMPLVVRDLARASQKEVRIEIQGEMVEVDKLLVERLLDPLIHLVRNAITHGIETPAERAAQGKPAQGRLVVRGAPEGDHILIEVSDDGRGMDLPAIAERARQLGWRKSSQPVSHEEALEWITRPGFSTHGEADLAAGRGVGLDVVQRMVRSFGGRLSMETAPGVGTTFRLRLPLTLVVIDALLVRSGADRYAIPRDAVERMIEFEPAQVVRVEGGEMLPLPDGYALLYRLDHLVGSPPVQSANGSPLPARSPNDASVPERLYGMILAPDFHSVSVLDGAPARWEPRAGTQPPLLKQPPLPQQRPLLVVDRVYGMQEVVVQNLTDPLLAQPGIAGATEMGDGSVVLILDLPTLLRQGQP